MPATSSAHRPYLQVKLILEPLSEASFNLARMPTKYTSLHTLSRELAQHFWGKEETGLKVLVAQSTKG